MTHPLSFFLCFFFFFLCFLCFFLDFSSSDPLPSEFEELDDDDELLDFFLDLSDELVFVADPEPEDEDDDLESLDDPLLDEEEDEEEEDDDEPDVVDSFFRGFRTCCKMKKGYQKLAKRSRASRHLGTAMTFECKS